MMPLPIDEIITEMAVPADLFIRLSDQKFVLIAKAGTKPEIDRFRNYQSKEVVYLWVDAKEYSKLTKQALTVAGVAMQIDQWDDKAKTSAVSQAARGVFTSIENQGMTPEVFHHAKQVQEVVVTMVERQKSLAEMFESLKSCSDVLVAHSVAVSAISVMIGRELGFEKKENLEKLALGGLLHDIGIKGLPKHLLGRPITEMTPEEIHEWQQHTFLGMDMLQKLKIVPEDIVAMAFEHHENSAGTGFPLQIRDVKIQSLAKIVGLANAYVDMVLPNVNPRSLKTPVEALHYIEETFGQPYNKEIFAALKRVIQVAQENDAALAEAAAMAAKNKPKASA